MTRQRRVELAAALVLGAAAACAHIEPPPGGPEDKEAPQLVATRPDTMAKLSGYRGEVLLVFSEGLSEQGIDTLVNVSPRTSSVSVEKSGDELSVSLRGGWQPNRIYQVTVSPGLRDRFGNATTEPIRLVFSTGPEIPNTFATGTVIERTTLRPLVGGRVEAELRPDSVVYTARTDSAGRFTFQQVPPGEYRLRAYTDQNRSRSLDEFEARDSTLLRVAVGDTATAARLAVILPDTTPPKAGSARGEGTVVEVRFDDFLDPAQPLATRQVTLTGPGGAAVAVTAVRVGPFPELRDTSRAAGDTAGAAARDAGRAARARPAGQVRDTAVAGPPADSLPHQSLFVRTAAPLAPETEYRVSVTGVRNLLGLVGGGETTLRTPRAQAPRDTTGVRPRGQPPRPDRPDRPAQRDSVRPAPANPPPPPANPPAPAPAPVPAPPPANPPVPTNPPPPPPPAASARPRR